MPQRIQRLQQQVQIMASGSRTLVPSSCNNCQILREIYHTDGTLTKKLEIHGAIGAVFHAVLLHHTVNEDPSQGFQFQRIFDLSQQSMEGVKQFLIQYFLIQNIAGLKKLPEHLLPFYEALSTNPEWDEENVSGYDLTSFLEPSETIVPPQQFLGESVLPLSQLPPPEGAGPTTFEVGQSSRPSIQVQREKRANMSLEELSGYFHLTMREAAELIQLSQTAMKKLCRARGVPRWPFRTVHSLAGQIAKLKAKLPTGDLETDVGIHLAIQELKEKMASICGGVLPKNLILD